MIKRQLTHKSFLTRLFSYQKQIDKLNTEYANKYCKLKPGQVIPLTENTKEGFDKFTIEKIMPDVERKGKGYTIGFLFYGEYSGNGKKQKGPLRIKSSTDKAEA